MRPNNSEFPSSQNDCSLTNLDLPWHRTDENISSLVRERTEFIVRRYFSTSVHGSSLFCTVLSPGACREGKVVEEMAQRIEIFSYSRSIRTMHYACTYIFVLILVQCSSVSRKGKRHLHAKYSGAWISWFN